MRAECRTLARAALPAGTAAPVVESLAEYLDMSLNRWLATAPDFILVTPICPECRQLHHAADCSLATPWGV